LIPSPEKTSFLLTRTTTKKKCTSNLKTQHSPLTRSKYPSNSLPSPRTTSCYSRESTSLLTRKSQSTPSTSGSASQISTSTTISWTSKTSSRTPDAWKNKAPRLSKPPSITQRMRTHKTQLTGWTCLSILKLNQQLCLQMLAP